MKAMLGTYLYLKRIYSNKKIKYTVGTVHPVQLLEWRHFDSSAKKKIKTTFLDRKIMTTIFWDRKSPLLVEFFATRSTINSTTIAKSKKNYPGLSKINGEEC